MKEQRWFSYPVILLSGSAMKCVNSEKCKQVQLHRLTSQVIYLHRKKRSPASFCRVLGYCIVCVQYSNLHLSLLVVRKVRVNQLNCSCLVWIKGSQYTQTRKCTSSITENASYVDLHIYRVLLEQLQLRNLTVEIYRRRCQTVQHDFHLMSKLPSSPFPQ